MVVLWLLAACAGPTAEVKVTKAPEVHDDRLGRGDLFEVRVFGEEELSSQYQVTADGQIEFPFVGAVTAMGRTPGELARDIRDALVGGGYLRDPHVSVLVVESSSRRISVIGAVARPGTFSITPGLSLVQVISLAGGFSNLADRDRTVVSRTEDNVIKRYQIPVDAIAQGVHEDFVMRPGDIVFVPERIF